MFKKKLMVGFFIGIGFILLSACGSDGVNPSTDSGEQPVESGEVLQSTIMGGRTGGAWSVFTEGVAESIRRENDSSLITVEPGGIVENPLTVGMNKASYALSYAMTAYSALNGEEPYDQAYEDIRAISVVIPANYYQFIVRADVAYDSLEEMIENQEALRLSVDQKGSAGEMITRHILQEYGITYDDIISWGGSVDHLGGSKTFELMADKRMDATGDAVSVPSSEIIEASTTNDLKLFGLNKEVIQNVSKNLGMEPGIIEAGSYEFLEKDIETVSTPVILIVNKNVPEDEVYQITNAIYENLEYLDTVHEEFKNLSHENVMEVGSIPLHPGAEKFFKEKGLID